MRDCLGSARVAVVLSILLGLTGVLTIHAQAEWTITDLGTLGGLYGDAQDINDAGYVVGDSSVVVNDDPFLQVDGAFVWTPSGGMVPLGTGSGSSAQAINNAGEVVGFFGLGAATGVRAFLWTEADGVVNLGYLGEIFPGFASSSASDINELEQVVGQSSVPGGSRAFLWTRTSGMVSLGTLGGSNSSARAINDAGQVVGQSDTASGDEHAFLWTAADGMIDLGTLGGSSSTAADINEAGQVVGRAATASGDEHGFLWTAAGGMIDLGTLGGAGSRSQAEGINDAGEVVGLFNDNDDHAFYWTQQGGMVQLPTLTGIESAARAINNVGQLAGYGDIATGDAHAVIWTHNTNPPDPEEQITSLEASVQDLVASGSLKTGQATGLNRPLENALRSLASGKLASACAQLGDFQVEVAKKVSDGALTPAEGAALIESATSIRAALGC